MKTEKTNSEIVDVSAVQANTGQVKGLPKNPRFIKNEKFRKLVKSIEDFPEMLALRPIVVDENMVVLGGNMRLKACQELGIKQIHIVKAIGLSIEQKKEFLVKDNVSFGNWDLDDLFSNTDEWNKDLLDSWGFDELIEDDETKLDTDQIDSKYTDENCAYPIIPMFDEKYNAFIIICETETQEAGIRTKFDIPTKAQSYKNKFLGRSNIVHAKDLLK